MKERKELYDSKLQLINYKLNQSISKPLASFVVTSFVSDAYCKRENLENQLQTLYKSTMQSGGQRPSKEVVERLKEEALPFV